MRGRGRQRGPRNPWLPGGGEGDAPAGREGPRRSANIEDIFRNRGPEGPRRQGSGGPGGPGFRMPQRPGGKSWFPVLVVGIIALGLLATSVHLIGPQQQDWRQTYLLVYGCPSVAMLPSGFLDQYAACSSAYH